MQYTIRELFDKHIASDDDVFSRLAVYPFALPMSWFVLNFTNLSANAITYTGLALGVSGCLAAIATQQLIWLCVGFCLFYVCDFVDGQVASVRGGSQFGAMLDLATDRGILLLSVLCLGQFHAVSGQTIELLLLLCYFGLHTYVDLVLFAKHRATNQSAAIVGPELPQSARRERGSGFSLWRLLPSRLSSPLAFIGVYALSSSFVAAYCVALIWVITEYISSVVKLAITWGRPTRAGTPCLPASADATDAMVEMVV